MKSIKVINNIVFDNNYYDDMEKNKSLYMITTKQMVMEFSKDIVLTGNGSLGRKLWQLPARTKVEISKMLKPKWEEIYILKELDNDLE
jgi:enamine deaminase RidA (YjgF/YER057c/UK114 family)